MMTMLLVAAFGLSLLPIPICVWLARRARQPVKIFDDVVSHLAWPLLLLPFVVTLPRTALLIVLGVAAAILIARVGPLIRRRRAILRRRGDGASDGR